MCPGRFVHTQQHRGIVNSSPLTTGRHTYQYNIIYNPGTSNLTTVKSSIYSGYIHNYIDTVMLNVWIFLVAASSTVSAAYVSRRQLSHGDYLTLDLPERTNKLEFSTADEEEHITIWQHKMFWPSKASKGSVYSSNDGWTFRIKHVTFDDEGTYTLRNYWNNIISTYTVKVITKRNIIERIPGETLTIPLEGIKKVNATLHFYSNYSVVTLVENGVPVSNTHPNYISRLKVTSDNIQVLNANVSDLGRYELTDHKGRLVSNNTMILVDHHSFTPNKGLIALLLLGIPGGICYCCRRRICKSCRTTKSHTSTFNPDSQPISHPVTDPSQGDMAGYPTSPGQGQIYYPPPDQGHIQYPPPDQGQGHIQYPPPDQGHNLYPAPDQGQGHILYPALPQQNGQPAHPPNPGFYSEYAPQDPVYALDFGPGAAPAQPTQWNVPPSQYNLSAPVDYNPMMNSAPSGPEPTALKMNELSPAAPLLTPQPESSAPRVSLDVLSSSDSAVQFEIDKGKSSTSNFL